MKDMILAGAHAMGIALPAEAPERFALYHALLTEANRTMNLTRVPDDPTSHSVLTSSISPGTASGASESR